MDKPPPDPAKLLAHWMEWEKGETTPGRTMSNLKTGGLRDLQIIGWISRAAGFGTHWRDLASHGQIGRAHV